MAVEKENERGGTGKETKEGVKNRCVGYEEGGYMRKSKYLRWGGKTKSKKGGKENEK